MSVDGSVCGCLRVWGGDNVFQANIFISCLDALSPRCISGPSMLVAIILMLCFLFCFVFLLYFLSFYLLTLLLSFPFLLNFYFPEALFCTRKDNFLWSFAHHLSRVLIVL